MIQPQQIISVEYLKCNSCGYVTLMPKRVCPKCASTDIEITQSPGKGELVDFTTIFYPPDSYKGREPYTSVLVKLSNGCKVFGVIESEVKDIRLGSSVRVAKYDETTGGFIFELG